MANSPAHPDDGPPSCPDELIEAAHAILKQEIKHLQLIPGVALKLLKLTSAKATSIKDLSTVIETEPALAAKVLRTVNSAAFFLPNRVNSIRHAVSLLGFSEIRQTALDQLFYNRLIRVSPKQRFNQLFFWQHCLFVASLSRAIAVSLRHPDPDIVYTGGLLHDIGKVVLESNGKLTYSEYLTAFEKSDCTLLQSERAFFGITHAEMGQVFCWEWNLPPVLTAMVAFHHELPPADSPLAAYTDEAAIVAFANYIAWVQGVGSCDHACGPLLQADVLRRVDISRLDLERLLEQVDREMVTTRKFYGIEFPDIQKLRATLLHSTLKLGLTERPRSSAAELGDVGTLRLASILTVPHRSLDPDEFMPSTLQAIQEHLGFDRITLMSISREHRGLSRDYAWPAPPKDGDDESFVIPMTAISGKLLNCLRNKQPVVIGKGDLDDDRFLARFGVDEFAAWPVLAQNKVAGVLSADNISSRARIHEEVLARMMPIINELGVALHNARRYRLAQEEAQIDALTRLYNKAMINRSLREMFEDSPAAPSGIAVGFIDVDHFKRFNDLYGHQAGDDVLKIVADILRNMTRPNDRIGRYGGEEFLVILREADRDSAYGYGQRIRNEVERRGKILRKRFQDQALTVSVGLAVYKPGYRNAEEMIEAADRAMYRAKHEGRNRVVVI